jgi:hypothetical protein
VSGPVSAANTTTARRPGVELDRLRELEVRLHQYSARVRIDDGYLRVRIRVVGHEGPASAVGDAAQQLGHHAANVGVRSSRVEFVSAERIEATVPRV